MTLFLCDHRAGLLAFDPVQEGTVPAGLAPDAAVGPLAYPLGVVHADGETVLVVDSGNNRIVALPLDGSASRSVDASGAAAGAFAGPRSVAVLTDRRLVVADTGRHRLMTSGFTLDVLLAGGATTDDWTAYGAPGAMPAGVGKFNAPQSVHVDSAGQLFVTDPGLRRLVRLDGPDGKGWTELALPPGPAPAVPFGLGPGPDGGILVTDLANRRVVHVDTNGAATILIDGTDGDTLVAPAAAVVHDDRIVVGDAAAALLTVWSNDGQGWVCEAQLRGDPGTEGGSAFGAVVALATSAIGI